ncbi:MAG: hemerythrin family protein [Bryobacterales bacterium]|nr:hemerythrin family protein [Bryobacterales bacterium]
MPFTWPEDCTYGDGTMAEEHRELIGLVRKLEEGLHAGLAQAELLARMDRALALLRTHLDAEEAALRAAGYPHLGAHRAQHDDMTRALLEFRANVGAGTAQITESVLHFVFQWFRTHSKYEDRAAAEYLRSLAAAP